MTSVPDFIDTAARLHGDTLALRFGDFRWTYRELRDQVVEAARWLGMARDQGRVGILSANHPGVVVAAHACARLGTSYVPHGFRLTTDELEWQVREAEVTTLVVDEQRASLALDVASRCVVQIIPLANLMAPSSPRTSAPAPVIDLQREAAVLFTSGTTGRPKGARITYGNLWFSAAGSALFLGHQPGDVWLATLSLHHIGGLSILYRAVTGGATVDLYERFDEISAISSIQAGSNFVSLVPTMLQRVLNTYDSESPWPPTLRGVLLGGAAAPRALIERGLVAGLPLLPTYGLTETSSQAATLRPAEVLQHPESSGRALPLTELRIVVDGNEGLPGEPGEIEVRGPSVFAGYLGEPDRDPASWFATGDVGYLDEDGFLHVVDRRNDLIVSGGENIYPAEIERVLLDHPLVRDAAVVGVTDEKWGARPIAGIEWTGPTGTAETELREHCRTALSAFKVPDRITEMATIPRSPAGKLLRREVRHMLGVS